MNNKEFKAFFGTVVTIIILSWVLLSTGIFFGVRAIQEHGLKGVIEQVWCGQNSECAKDNEENQ